MNEQDYSKTRERLKTRYLGKHSIHAIGGDEAKGEIRVYSTDKIDEETITGIVQRAKPFSIVFKLQTIPEASTGIAE